MSLNVLILEDRLSDAKLMAHELVRAGFEVNWTRATSRDEFVAGLTSRVDVVLADFSLPGFDATQALDLVLRAELNIPFIIVSGTIGEETAVAAMKRGATDYILKDRLLRLGPAVREALEVRRLRQEKASAFRLLQEREARFSKLIEHSADGILLVSPEGAIKFASASAGRIAQCPADALVGRSIFEFISPRRAGVFYRRYRRLVKRNEVSLASRFPCRKRDAEECWIEATVRNLLDDAGVNAVVVNFREVTARFEAERKLQHSARELVLKNEVLDRNSHRLVELNAAAHQLVENVSHDFRTPLTVLTEYCSLLSEEHGGTITDEQREFLEVMSSRIEDLSLMVDNLLDVSAHESGIMRMFRNAVPVGAIVDRVRAVLERRAAARKIELRISVSGSSTEVFCDDEQIRRVIINLAVNALKFAEPGSRVHLWSVNRAAAGEVEIGVTDNGPGIAQCDLKRLFDRFQQLGHASATKGFGLGLSIAKEFVQVNLGTLHVKSELGRGSTFSFCIPRVDPAVVFPRYLGLLKAENHRTPYVSLFVVGAECRQIENVSHLLRLKLHNNDLAFPCGHSRWCVVTPCGESEQSRFMDGLRSEWMQLGKNSLAGNIPELDVSPQGCLELGSDDAVLLGRFRWIVGRVSTQSPLEPYAGHGRLDDRSAKHQFEQGLPCTEEYSPVSPARSL